MRVENLEGLRSEIAAMRVVRSVGRIASIGRGSVQVTGLGDIAAMGDFVGFSDTLQGEVIGLEAETITVLPDGTSDGLSIGDRVRHLGENEIAPDDTWIGRIIDPFGNALDDKPIFRGPRARALRPEALPASQRRGLGVRLDTGLAVFNTLLPIVHGQRIGLFAGAGIGKSMLLAKLARGLLADVVVIALIGERGREVREFVDRALGVDGMKRTIVVAATSDKSPLIRRRCALAAMAVAEHFRDSGLHVLFLGDSITRFAEAHREVALAAGEAGSLRGFPPSTTHMITSLCERAGPGIDGTGDITAVMSVLVAGSDMDEPIADTLRGVLDGHVILDRRIAERGRFPAIDMLRSVSRALPEAATPEENALIAETRRRLGAYDRAEMMIQAGLYKSGSDPEVDAAVTVWPKLDKFLAQDEPDGIAGGFNRLRDCLSLEAPPD